MGIRRAGGLVFSGWNACRRLCAQQIMIVYLLHVSHCRCGNERAAVQSLLGGRCKTDRSGASVQWESREGPHSVCGIPMPPGGRSIGDGQTGQ